MAGQLLVYVRLPTHSNPIPVEISADGTVADLRSAVHSAGGPPPLLQRLTCGAEDLRGDGPVSETHVCMECTIGVHSKQPDRCVVNAGYGHALALLNDGSLTGWGMEDYYRPLPDLRGEDVRSLHAGHAVSLARLADGTVTAWGKRAARYRPGLEMLRGKRVVDLSFPPGFTEAVLAVTDDGSVHACGAGVGAGSIPRGAVTSVTCGVGFTVALTEAGGVVAAGDDRRGQCSVPDFGGRTATAVHSGLGHTAVVLDDGTVSCFGCNARGQCDVPADLPGVVSCRCGEDFTVALDCGGRLHVWGRSEWVKVRPSAKHRAVSACGGYCAAVSETGGLVVYGSRDPFETGVLRPPDLCGRRVAEP
eukprot:TRINITY_DN12101_c0_g1_i4.p1 TRINITY_DN12101_c0_g1~~TRINITY_DN12101_c0_g1_i4.p1  ORF type:complete len:362 (+),score=100.80 TRINITY_DN12101_c0_g1_i4:92-1177(+)